METNPTPTGAGLLDEVREAMRPYSSPEPMPRPMLFERSPSGEWATYPHEEIDVYDLLAVWQNTARTSPATVSAFALITSGWACPIPGPDAPPIPPSQSPDRVRVTLCAVLGDTGTHASSITLHRPDGVEDVREEGVPSGSLMDALDRAGLAVWGDGFALGLLRLLEQDDAHTARRVRSLLGGE